jgi:uncharacterized membrane protein
MSDAPSKLMALVFDDPYTADEARAALRRMGGEGLLEIDETSVIFYPLDGKMQISQDLNVVAKDQHVGHLAGLVVAAITGTMPFILAGTVGGALIGKLTDHGITNKFLKQVGQQLRPGMSVLVILGRSDPERRRKVVERLRVFRPTIVQSDLPPWLEDELDRELHG